MKCGKTFLACISFAFLAWTAWCALMVYVGAPFDWPAVRAIARFSALAIPAYFLVRTVKPSGSDRFRFKTNARLGLFVGVAVSVVWAALHFQQQFQVPTTTHAWLNVIVLSPIAEELLFRVAVISFLVTKMNAIKAAVLSAVLFALVHLPWWILSGEKSFQEIASLLAIMFVYGLVFAILYVRTKSIWASLIPHSVNNLIAISLVSL